MEPLRDRNFRLLFAGRAISYIGTYLAPIAVAFAVLDLGGSATAVGLSFAAWTVAQVATLAFGGVIGDRFPRRIVMISSDVASTAVRTAMGVLLVTGHAQVWELIALQALGGAAVAFYNPAFYGLVPRGRPQRSSCKRANSLLGIARYAAFPLGAAAGGTIVATVGSGTALLFDGGTYAASALLLSLMHVRVRRARAQELRARAARGLERLRRAHVGLGALLWIALYFLITYAPFFVLGPYIAKHSLSGASSWGAVVTGEGIGALLGALAGLRFRPGRPLVATALIFLPTAVQSVLLAFHAPVAALAPAALFAGFGFSCGSVVWDTSLQRMIPPEKLARVAAYGWMSAMVFLPAGYALAGPIASVVGMRGYLLFGAGWLVASTVFIVQLKSVREFTLEPAVETAPVAAT